MKTKLTAFILIGLTVVLLSFLITPRIVINHYWKRTDELYKVELYKSALDYALKAKKLAKTWHLKPAYVKSLLYEIKCKAQLGSGMYEITVLLRNEKNITQSPAKEIITSLYLEKLWDSYYHSQRRYYMQETFLDESNDLKDWSSERILKEIVNQIDTLSKAKYLTSYSFAKYQNNLCSSSKYQIRFNTVYEFVTWHSIEILNWSNRFFYNGVMHNESNEFFVPLKKFLSMSIAPPDTLDLYTKSMVLYQDLLKFEKDNFNHKLTYEIEIERLNNLQSKGGIENLDSKFIQFLETYRKEAQRKDVRLVLDFALFNAYRSADMVDGYRKKCLEIIQHYPAYLPEVIECKKFLKELTNRYITIQTSNLYTYGKPIDIEIASRNIDTVYLSLFKLPLSYMSTQNIDIKTDSAYQALPKEKFESKILSFKKSFDQTENKKLTYSNLDKGVYLAAIGRKANLENFGHVDEWHIFRVTSIGSFSYDDSGMLEVYAVNRNNGVPLSHATVTISPDKKPKYALKTDELGKVRINEKNSFSNITIGYEGDTIAFWERYYYSNNNEDETYHTELFTDRAVYRPSQKVYFKGILDRRDQRTRKCMVVPNHKVRVTFKSYDVVYGEVDAITNEFGSFSGTFQLPAKVSLGQMEINTDYGEQYIQIEEYKPTKLRLSVLPYTQPTNIGDSIVITGYAKYLNGLPARNLLILYKVSRSVSSNYRRSASGVASGTLLTDQLGQFNIRLKTMKSSNDPNGKGEYNYDFNIDCKDDFGEIQSTSCSISVGKNSCEAKISIDKYLLKKSMIKVPVSFLYNNNPVSPTKCQLRIYKLIEDPKKSRQYSDISSVNFDSLVREKKVFDKTIEYPANIEFNASELTQSEEGFYVAEVNALVNNKIEVTGKEYFTLFEAECVKPKLNVTQFFIAFAEEAEPGQVAQFCIGSASPDVYGLLSITKKEKILSREWIHLSNNQKIINIPVKEAYQGGFNVSFSGFVNGGFFNERNFIKVPFKDKKLNIAFKKFRGNLFPGQHETWQLQVKDKTGKPANAEMVATLYDEALDEIEPHYFSYFPYGNFEENEYYNNRWEELSCNAIHGSGGQKNYIFIDAPPPPPPFEGNFGMTSNFPVFDWQLEGKIYGRSTFFYNNRRDYKCCDKAKFSADRTSFSSLASASISAPPPPLRNVVKFTPPNVTMEDFADEKPFADDAPLQTKASPTKMRKDFRETAFFVPQATTDGNGLVTFNFTMPDALTRWKMLGFAHTKDMKTGSISNELVTQKDFMVFPNWPRFFRSGDTVSFNVRIENNVAKTLNGNVTIEIEDASNHKTITKKVIQVGINQKFSIAGRSNTFAQWKLVIPQNAGALLFRVKAASGVSADGEEMIVPVLPNEVIITESMPFFIPDGKPHAFQFKNFKEQRETDIRNYQYKFEIAPNPKWNVITALGYLTDYPYECAEQTCNKYFGYSVAEYIANHNPSIKQFFNRKDRANAIALTSSLEANPDLKSCLLEESPWLFDAKTATENALKLSEHFNSKAIEDKKSELVEKLESFQNSDGGIAWFNGMKSSPYISYILLETFGKMNKLGILDTLDATLPLYVAKLITYCDATLLSWYKDNIKSKTNYFYLDKYLMTHYAYGRSYFLKNHPIPKETKAAYALLINQLGTNWQQASRYQKPLIALALFRNGNQTVTNQMIASLKELAVSDPNKGIYWNFGNDYYFNDVENEANILELFIETQQPQRDIDNIKNWLYLNKKDNHWYSTISTAKTCYSLLLKEPSWFTPASFAVNVGSYSFTASNSPSNPGGGYRKKWSANEVVKTMGDIKVYPLTNDRTPTWGAAYWQYFKRMDKLTETTTDVWIKKLYFVKRNKTYRQLNANDKLTVGDEMMVRLTCGTDKPLSYIHIKDLRPTCLEPINKTSGYHYQNELGYFESIRDVSQNFFIEYMPKGQYFIEYPVRVTHRGYFQTGNASIQCMYTPENVGNSRSSVLKVN